MVQQGQKEQIKQEIGKGVTFYCAAKGFNMDSRKDELNAVTMAIFTSLRTAFAGLAIGEIALIFEYALGGSLPSCDKYVMTADAFTIPAKAYYTSKLRKEVTADLPIRNALPEYKKPLDENLSESEKLAKGREFALELYRKMYNAYYYNKHKSEIAEFEFGSLVYDNLKRVGKVAVTKEHLEQAAENVNMEFKQTRNPDLKPITKIVEEMMLKGIEQIKTTFLRKEAERLCLKEYFEELIKKDKAKSCK
jgi:hypothetical protein